VTADDRDRLIRAASFARMNASPPYSGFKVGAALEDAAGRVHTGCNIENASYGLTVCAERVALWKAMSEGVRTFRRVAVVTAADKLTTPCGPCRQLLWEFCGNIEVILGNLHGESRVWRLAELLPEPFDDKAFR
jgi:cytidine deaminase